MEKQLSLNPGTYYRLYDNECYVWNTRTKRQFIFNHIVFYLLNLIEKSEPIECDLLIEKFFQICEGDRREIREAVFSFVDELCKEKIIKIQYPDEKSIDFDRVVVEKLSKKRILFSVLFELTYNCNEKCQHCYVDTPYREHFKELSTDDVKLVIDNLYRANVAEITFSGGEIFTRKDSVEIIEYATRKGFLVNIFSNGTLLTPDMILRLSKCNIRSFQSSIYGSTAKVHDTITKINGSFEKTKEVLEMFSTLGVSTCIKTTMMKNNVMDYAELIKLANSIGSQIQIGLSLRPTMLKQTENAKYRISNGELEKICLEEIKRFGVDDNEEIVLENSGLCHAGFSEISIDPYGDIYLCSGLPFILGNATRDEIKDIWEKSEDIANWRKKTLADVKCMNDCEYASDCNYCPAQAYLETGNCFDKYEEACNIAKAQRKAEEVYQHGKKDGI